MGYPNVLVRIFNCLKCRNQSRTLKKAEDWKCRHCGTTAKKNFEEVLTAPNSKFMEPKDEVAKAKGKSQLKNQQKILRERTRNWSRENETHDLIQKNPEEEAVKNQWINADGSPRKKIDDL